MHGRRLLGIVVLSALALSPVGGSQAVLPPEHGYVTDAMRLGTTQQEISSFGRDFDGNGSRDNKLAQLVPVMAMQGIDLATTQQDAITSGDIVMLHSLRAARLTNTNNATWQVWYGAPTVDPDLSGSGTFTLLSGQPHSLRIAATITNHLVRTVAGKIPIRWDLGDGPFVLWLTKAKVVATCFQAHCIGRVNGAVTKLQIDGKLIPEIQAWIQAAVTRDCTGPEVNCAGGSEGEVLQQIFDVDNDLQITLNEVRNNSLIQTILAPDLDLNHDGVEDAISFGFGIDTVHATLTRP